MFLGATAFEAKFACADAVTGPASSCDTIKSTWLILAYSYLGEGECRQSDGNYPIKFSIGYDDLNLTRAVLMLNKLWTDVRQSVSHSRGV